MLTYGLTNFDLVEISKSKVPLDKVDVWLGKESTVDVYTKNDIYKIIKKGQKRKLKIKVVYNSLYLFFDKTISKTSPSSNQSII